MKTYIYEHLPKIAAVGTGLATLAGIVKADNAMPTTYGTMTYIFDGIMMVVGGIVHGIAIQATTIGSAMGMTIALGMVAAIVASVAVVFVALMGLAYVSRKKK